MADQAAAVVAVYPLNDRVARAYQGKVTLEELH
jgi:hypothetical protein